jgi:hypothetical protein
MSAQRQTLLTVWDVYRQEFPGWEMPEHRVAPGRHRAPVRKRLRGVLVAAVLLFAAAFTGSCRDDADYRPDAPTTAMHPGVGS